VTHSDDTTHVEIRAESRPAEARRILAVVSEYADSGGSPSDVAVVAPDPDAYEAPLSNAASRHGLPIATWTQLPLTDTLPYRLVAACCRVLDSDPCSCKTFLTPLVYQWTLPSLAATDASRDPNESPASRPPATIDESVGDTVAGDSAVSSLRATFRDDLQGDETPAREAVEWCRWITNHEVPPVVETYCEWVKTHHHEGRPQPEAVDRALSPVLNAYEEVVLPARYQRDDSTLSQTAQTARAVDRTQDLVTEVVKTYDDRIETGEAPSWALVDDLAETIGELRAGRREHANAHALDVIDANDTWGLSRDVVIAVGLRQGGWIESRQGHLPSALQAQLWRRADVPVGVRAAWSEDQVRDHFRDTVSAASDTLVCTRPERDRHGTTVPPSPLLADLDTETVTPTEVFADD
jgi:ATP-dependent helicase/nuclease subunit B